MTGEQGLTMADFLNHLPTILWGLIALYGLSVAVFILMENRSPHLTLTWLFVFIFMPMIGVLVYIFFGRGFTLFSQRDKLIKQELTTRLSLERVPLMERQEEEIEKLKQAGPPVYGRVVELMRRNADSPLFPHNCLEILQNGAEKYPPAGRSEGGSPFDPPRILRVEFRRIDAGGQTGSSGAGQSRRSSAATV